MYGETGIGLRRKEDTYMKLDDGRLLRLVICGSLVVGGEDSPISRLEENLLVFLIDQLSFRLRNQVSKVGRDGV